MVTETRTVKISADNYRAIHELVGELQKNSGAPVSVDKAIAELLKKRPLRDLAGSWKMSDRESKDIFQSLRKGWGSLKMKIPSHSKRQGSSHD